MVVGGSPAEHAPHQLVWRVDAEGAVLRRHALTPAQQQLAAELEAEREKRVAHVQQIAVRRLGQMALARGWSSWHELWEVRSQEQRRLRAVGGRLMRPKLSAALSHWRHDWEAALVEAQLAASELSFAEQLKGQEASLTSELEQVRA